MRLLPKIPPSFDGLVVACAPDANPAEIAEKAASMINSFLELRKLGKLLATVTFCGPMAGCPIAAGTCMTKAFSKGERPEGREIWTRF